MIVTCLVIIMCGLLFIKTTRSRKITISIFVFEKAFSEWIFIAERLFSFTISGSMYYVIMSLLDFMTIFVLSNIKNISKLLINLQRICLVSMFLNFAAWMSFSIGIKHAYIYNKSYIFLYAVAILLIVRKGKNNDGDHRLDLWAWNLRLDNYQSLGINK